MSRETLTKENAHKANRIISKDFPEWGPKKFNYNEQPLSNGRKASIVGIGSDSFVLFESEYKFWEIVD